MDVPARTGPAIHRAPGDNRDASSRQPKPDNESPPLPLGRPIPAGPAALIMALARILVVDDEPDIRELVQEILADEGYEVETAENGQTARECYQSGGHDLILLDIWMPDIDGISLLAEWGEQGALKCPVVILSGHGTVETAVEATRLGAFDFIEKPLSLAKLLLTVKKALERAEMPKSPRLAGETGHSEPIGNSLLMQSVRRKAEQVAQHDASVLISGEPGSGKQVLARYVHQRSVRREGPFVLLEPGMLQTDRLRPQLLGDGSGDSQQQGLLERAADGTLYVADIGGLPMAAQELLAQVLEAGQYQREGADEIVPLAARFIGASRLPPENLVRQGKLLDRLYFRLNVLPLQLPPLRERPEDVPDLVRHFADYFPMQEDLPYRQFPVAVQNRLRNHPWPGNVRELRNVVQRLLILGDGTDVTLAEVDEALKESAAGIKPARGDYPQAFDLPLREAREQFERDYLIFQLKRAGGSVGKLADVVGMERTHLYRKLRALGIDPKSVARGENP